MNKYNTHFPDDATPESLIKDREEMLKGIMGRIGSGSFIEPPVNIDYGCNITIGDNFYSNFKCVFFSSCSPPLITFIGLHLIWIPIPIFHISCYIWSK